MFEVELKFPKKILFIITLIVNMSHVSAIQASAAGSAGKEKIENANSGFESLKKLYLESELSTGDKRMLCKHFGLKVIDATQALLKKSFENFLPGNNHKIEKPMRQMEQVLEEGFESFFLAWKKEEDTKKFQLNMADMLREVPRETISENIDYLSLLEKFRKFVEQNIASTAVNTTLPAGGPAMSEGPKGDEA